MKKSPCLIEKIFFLNTGSCESLIEHRLDKYLVYCFVCLFVFIFSQSLRNLGDFIEFQGVTNV